MWGYSLTDKIQSTGGKLCFVFRILRLSREGTLQNNYYTSNFYGISISIDLWWLSNHLNWYRKHAQHISDLGYWTLSCKSTAAIRHIHYQRIILLCVANGWINADISFRWSLRRWKSLQPATLRYGPCSTKKDGRGVSTFCWAEWIRLVGSSGLRLCNINRVWHKWRRMICETVFLFVYIISH